MSEKPREAGSTAAEADQPVVEVRGVTYAYQGHPAVEDATFEIGDHDFVSIVGPNGGGKTTLLKLILGLLEPHRGTVRVLGRPPRKARSRVGYVPQHSEIDLRVPANLMDVVLTGKLGSCCRVGPWRKKDRAEARQALQRVGLRSMARRQLGELSGGQRQRVMIARALASDPELLLMDEPMAGLDVAAEEELYDYLDELSRRLTVVMVSHDLGFVGQFVRTVICVNRTVRVHPTHEVTGEVIREVYGTDVRMVRHDHNHLGSSEEQAP